MKWLQLKPKQPEFVDASGRIFRRGKQYPENVIASADMNCLESEKREVKSKKKKTEVKDNAGSK